MKVSEQIESPSEFLKRHTLEIHRAAESTGFLKQLFNPRLIRSDYILILQKLFSVLSPIEVAILASPYLKSFPSVQHRVFYQGLCQDLAYFKKIDSLEHEQSRYALLDLSTRAATAGALYVLEGSANGGQILCSLLQDRLELTKETGLAYFALQASNGKSRFAAFKMELDQQLQPSECREAADVAQLVFGNFIS